MTEHPVSIPDTVYSTVTARPKEFDLLCLCSAAHLSPERIAGIDRSTQLGIDWNVFLTLAEFHGVLPLAAQNLSPVGALPAATAQTLKSAFEMNARRSLWFAGEMLRIAEHFDDRKIKIVPYKGPVLAESAYGDVALRNFSDLDFLIVAEDLDRAKHALSELRYQPSHQLTPPIEAFWLRNGYECSFDCPAGKNLVELQWGLAPRFFAVGLLTRELFQRSQRILFGGHEVWSLSPEDTLLVLCIHAAKHLWMRLIWLCDIAELLRKHPIDFELVLSRARVLGVSRFVVVSLWLANNLLGCAIPRATDTEISADSQVRILGEQFAARLARSATYSFESIDYFRWILKLRERPRDRLRFLWRLLWTPGAGDLAALTIPQPLFPLYHGVRLLRLMRKLI